jgi:sulfate adenylyltransferase
MTRQAISMQAHGGKLVNRKFLKQIPNDLKNFEVKEEIRNDLENISEGIFSPIEGFLCEADFESVVRNGRLSNQIPWTIPIVLDVNDSAAKEMSDLKDIVLSVNGLKFCVLHVDDVYGYKKLDMARMVYNTTDVNHPGVKKITRMNDKLIGGKIELIPRENNDDIRKFRMTPSDIRGEINKRGWKTVVGFQTRNVPHIAHEMLQKAALNIYDGLFINPLIGKKKTGDFTDSLIIQAYDTLIKNYYSQDSILFATLHTEMRYAGPREAIHHAIMRKNFGCTHFIVGRDHAGVGNYYSPFAAHEIFDEYPDLGIEPIFFPSFYYCKKCGSYANEKICPHEVEFRDELSGTAIRKMVQTGKTPANHLMRPEIANLILNSKNPFVGEE